MANDSWPEPVGISPRLDCVFKTILGVPERSSVLLDFLQAVLGPEIRIASVEITNPVHLPEHLKDATRAVDVAAKDVDGRVYQIEMQSWNEVSLKERMLYMWSLLYHQQLGQNDTFQKLRPVISIWLLDQNTLRNAPSFHHRFQLRDEADGCRLTNHIEIHTLELEKWRSDRGRGPAGVERWMAFFAEAEDWAAVPQELASPALEEAMSVLNQFKTNAELNETYHARLDFQRREGSREQAKDMAEAGERAALAREAQALAEKDQALAREAHALARAEGERREKETLREKLRKAGINPDG